MAVWALGLNHNTAPLDIRGKFAFAVDQMGLALSTLRANLQGQNEATILSTCNRTEIYCSGTDAQLPQTLEWLARQGAVATQSLNQHLYCLQDQDVTRHAFRVASGLDSMVLGEPQILGQMKDAVRIASSAGALGTTLNQLFQRSFSVAKEVRSTTEIGAHSISMAAAAVRLAGQLFEDLSKTKVLFVGAGEMIELCIQHFGAKRPLSMTIANRTLEKGDRLAQEMGATVMQLSLLPERLHEFDVVVSCTASTLPLIGLGAVERAVKRRKKKPMFMLDLAVPRDIEPEVKSLSDVYLYNVDDLSGVVQVGQASRQAAVGHAETIIEKGVQNFHRWMDQRSSVPLIQRLNSTADEWRQAELLKARKMLARGENLDAVLETLSRGLVKKMMHGTMTELHAANSHELEAVHAHIEKLFLRNSN
ncbi:MAG: glutamyl-tRNA reductase [Burkholderiales bacterium]|nr:glutamyl-tRNA reductase [Burkholderiales bacterium]